MTVTYSRAVATISHWSFLKLLFRWKSSIYKVIWLEFIVFLILFGSFSLIYRVGMTAQIKREFEHFCLYCNKVSKRMPIGLFLGFYVNIIVGQWWGRFCAIPWPDSVVLAICAYIQGNSKSVTTRRHTLIRYVHLTYILQMRGMSSRVKQRYPSIEHVVTAGFMTEQEKDVFLQSGEDGESGIAFLPIMWAVDLINQLRTEGAIANATSVELLQQELRNFRGGFGVVWTYNYLSVPLAYTQISLIIIYSYFGLSIFAWQPLDTTQNYIGHNINVYVPVFGLLQLAFYVGWSKVAEILINPLGNDEDDFEIDIMIERNVQFSAFWLEAYQGEIPDLSDAPIASNGISELTSVPFRQGKTTSYKRRLSSTTEDPFWGSLTNINFPRRERPSPV